VYYNGMLGGCCGLPDWARNTIVDQLRQSTTYGTDGYYQRFGIPTGLPDEPTLGVKQGWMDVNGQRYNHTTGIIGNDNRFVLVVLGHENDTNGDVNHTTGTLNQVVGTMYPERIVPRVQGAIADDWYSLGGANSPVGLPLGNENPIFDHSGVFTLFQRGRASCITRPLMSSAPRTGSADSTTSKTMAPSTGRRPPVPNQCTVPSKIIGPLSGGNAASWGTRGPTRPAPPTG